MIPDSPERWEQIDALFAEALDRPEAERSAFLAAACAGDPELLEAVRSLLASEVAAARMIGESVGDAAADLLASLSDEVDAAEAGMIGRIIGTYRLVAELGRGGMGVVYLAERADGEYDKRVALKLVKRGMDTDEILQRFHMERRILAALEHPNIAALYDGGATDDGRPYLVMEAVEGERITTYCDARRLTVAERLDLFRSVCSAVQYAHQKLVVHRDIKPSNVLVTAGGTPKLLDFGIARLLDAEPGGSMRTRTRLRMLTPDYAAPEQIRGDPVTTASDVHALGAVLYELLTGRRPYGNRDSVSAEEPGMERPIRRPSLAVAADADAEGVAIARGTHPNQLRRSLKGDLDTIILKALEPDPRLRYQSARELIEDLDRFRSGLPVTARIAGPAYRAGKFVRRHRIGLAAAAVVLVSLVSGLGAALWQAERADAERARAERERAIAEEQRDAAEEVAAFLEGMFAAANPFSIQPGRLDTMRIGTLLDRGASRIGTEFTDRPLIRARMQGVLGRAYRSLGMYDQAEPLLTQSLDTYRAVSGTGPDAANAMNALGNLYLDLERAADAENLHREALGIRRQLLGSDHSDVAQSLNNLAAALQNAGRLDEAEPLYDELLALHRRLDPPDSAAFADALNTRMVLAYRKDDFDTALPLAREILDINRALFGTDHPRVTQSMNNLGQLLSRTGELEEAETLMRESLEMNRTMLGGMHPNIAAGAANLAGVLLRLDRVEEAETLYLEAIAINRQVLGDRHPGLAISITSYADLLVARGALDEAERLQREALAINRAAFGATHINVGIVTARLAENLCLQGRTDAGRGLFRDALAGLRASVPETHSAVRSAREAASRCAVESLP
ncbi:MAG TPA: serine/threonine-protein kinase [Longimicrobiales bacterium]|nr:serine/threonine-protein kinase [Longimicrobiales bacterium]